MSHSSSESRIAATGLRDIGVDDETIKALIDWEIDSVDALAALNVDSAHEVARSIEMDTAAMDKLVAAAKKQASA